MNYGIITIITITIIIIIINIIMSLLILLVLLLLLICHYYILLLLLLLLLGHYYILLQFSITYPAWSEPSEALLRGGGRALLTEILSPRTARQGTDCLVSTRGQARTARIQKMSSMRSSNRIIPFPIYTRVLFLFYHSPCFFYNSCARRNSEPFTMKFPSCQNTPRLPVIIIIIIMIMIMISIIIVILG